MKYIIYIGNIYSVFIFHMKASYIYIMYESVKVTQTLCDPSDRSLLGSSVHGILQARILEWVDIPFCRGSSQPKDQTQLSCIAGGFFTI